MTSTPEPTAPTDDVLARLLQDSGSAWTPDAVRSLAAGVAVTPRPGPWTEAVDPSGHEGLRGALEALVEATAAALDDGLQASPAPPSRLEGLRAEMRRLELDALLVPRVDEHQGEYVPRQAQRLRWLTGFSGSAGVAAVLAQEAAIFVDGRYTLQVREQVDVDRFEPLPIPQEVPARWVAKRAGEGGRVGFDPWLYTVQAARELRQACADAGAQAVAVAANPVDAVWGAAQPSPPLGAARVHPLERAGVSSADKRRELAEALRDAGQDAVVLSLPDAICWLLNVRGGDVEHNPVVLSFAVARADASVDWFVDPRKVSEAVRAHLGEGVRVRPRGELLPALEELGAAGARVRLAAASTPEAVAVALKGAGSGARIIEADDPTSLPKAKKNAVGLDGMRACHRRDGVAMVRFLSWLEERAPKGGLTELAAARRLHELRALAPSLEDLSFETISGAGPNGAIVHYSVSPETDRELEAGTLYLVDSGGQYPDGTTDITRTVFVGAPDAQVPAEMRDHFTRVLRGHIDLGRAVFPAGTAGPQLDMLARAPLWEAGLDYNHGTGHGVGGYLCVHEGPQGISPRANRVALELGMVVSNEPGYYRAGAYGIRIENLVTVVEGPAVQGAERELRAFETITVVPMDRRLIDVAQLSDAQRAWVDDYHAKVLADVGPLLDRDEDAAARAWLEAACAPLPVA